MCMFCIKSYASTDYSVYSEETGNYTIKLSDTIVEELGLPFSEIPFYSANQDIYFFIYITGTGHYRIFIDSVNFVETDSDDEGFDGSSYNFKLSNNNKPYSCFYNTSTSTMGAVSIYKDSTYIVGLDSIVFSSDDICNNSSGNVIVPKTVITEDTGGTDNSGSSEDTGDTGSSEDRGEDFVLSSSYNTEWIESYLDLNQNPVDGIKNLIDSHQDYFNFDSSDLGNYWVCERIYYLDSEEYFYYFLIASGPLYAGNYYVNSHSYFVGYNGDFHCFPIRFVNDGFYADSNLTTESGYWATTGVYHTQYFTKDILPDNNSSDVAKFIILSNHDIYHD